MAYDFVLPSYQFMVGRMEAADARISTLLTTVSSFTLGIPLLAKATMPNIEFRSAWFGGAIAFALLAFGCGVAGRIRGRIVLPNPSILYQKFLHKSPWTFKKDAVYFAGQHFTANSQAIDEKGRLTIWISVVMFLSILSFMVWMFH